MVESSTAAVRATQAPLPEPDPTRSEASSESHRKAFNAGFRCGERGLKSHQNPYSLKRGGLAFRNAWDRGWNLGRAAQ